MIASSKALPRLTRHQSSIAGKSSMHYKSYSSLSMKRYTRTMSPTGGEITHVSDTALMVAACRAHETELERMPLCAIPSRRG
jgi:hypothetical protein